MSPSLSLSLCICRCVLLDIAAPFFFILLLPSLLTEPSRDSHATGTTYTYAGSVLTATPWTPLLSQLRDAASAYTGCHFNFVLVNHYRDGRDSMGRHRDNEPELDPAAPVVSLSLGATRDFVLHRGAERIVIPLRHGTLLAMDPPTNELWLHSLPRRTKVAAPRLNLTFRRLRPTSERQKQRKSSRTAE